jgi:hypothetical protein
MEIPMTQRKRVDERIGWSHLDWFFFLFCSFLFMITLLPTLYLVYITRIFLLDTSFLDEFKHLNARVSPGETCWPVKSFNIKSTNNWDFT